MVTGSRRITYWPLWILQGFLVLTIILILMLPIQDYALSEFKQSQDHPSAETLKAFEDKRKEELRIRLILATPLVGLALLLAARLRREAKLRNQSRSL